MMDEKQVKKIVEEMLQETVLQEKIRKRAIKQRHLEGYIIFRGAVADRPSNGNTEIQAYFAEDESNLYIWNTENEAWESVTLS